MHRWEFWKNLKAPDNIVTYVEDCDVENICACNILKQSLDHDRGMNLSVEEVRKFLGIYVLTSLKFPQTTMYWASTIRVERISTKVFLH